MKHFVLLSMVSFLPYQIYAKMDTPRKPFRKSIDSEALPQILVSENELQPTDSPEQEVVQEAGAQVDEAKAIEVQAPSTEAPAKKIPDAKEMVTINFAQPTPLADVLQAVSVWRGSNFVIDGGVNSNTKLQIISPEPVTKQEAYEAFLSALASVGLTVVESGKISKVISSKTASSHNLMTATGSKWALPTDRVYTQIIPLEYSNVNDVHEMLRNVVSGSSIVPFPATNSLLVTDRGFMIQRIQGIIEMLDVEKNRHTVNIIHVKNTDAKLIKEKVAEIYGRNPVTMKNVIVDERMNSLIIVASPKGLADVTKLIKRLDTPNVDPASQSQIHVRPLNYSNATKLSETLRRLSGGNNSSGGSRFPFGGGSNSSSSGGATATISAAQLGDIKITADESTNSLIIQGSQMAYENVNRIIEVLDQRRHQVFIEAHIIDVVQSKDLSFNTSFIAGTKLGENFVAPFGFTPEQAASLGLNINNSTQASTALLKAAQSVLSSQEAIFGVMAQQSIKINDSISLSPGAFIFALKGDMNANVLQTPSLLVANNEKALFEAGQNEWFNTTVFNPLGAASPKREKVEATLKLEIQPQLTSSDYINLDIDFKADDFGARNPQTHEVMNQQKRHTKTKVTVPSGRVVVLSGLTKDAETKSARKVPLLGDIPILGALFRDSKSTKTKNNLTVFLKPHIIRDADDLANIYKKKIQERDEYFKAIYGSKYEKKEFYKNGPKIEDGQGPVQEEAPVAPETSQISDSVDEGDEDGEIYVPYSDSAPIESTSTGSDSASEPGTAAENVNETNPEEQKPLTPTDEFSDLPTL